MLNFDTPVVLPLRPGQLLRWQQAAPVLLRVLHGRVWITRAGDLDDHFLDAGQQLRLAPRTPVLIGAEGAAQVMIDTEAPAGAPPPWPWRLLRSARPS